MMQIKTYPSIQHLATGIFYSGQYICSSYLSKIFNLQSLSKHFIAKSVSKVSASLHPHLLSILATKVNSTIIHFIITIYLFLKCQPCTHLESLLSQSKSNNPKLHTGNYATLSSQFITHHLYHNLESLLLDNLTSLKCSYSKEMSNDNLSLNINFIKFVESLWNPYLLTTLQFGTDKKSLMMLKYQHLADCYWDELKSWFIFIPTRMERGEFIESIETSDNI